MYSKEDYLTDFSQFEQWCKDHNYKDVSDLEYQFTPYTTIRNEIYFFRHIRNFLAHIPRTHRRLNLTDTFKADFKKLSHHFMAEKSELVIPESAIYKQRMIDPIGPAIKVMRERVYTHIPIMTGNRVWGVFSENTLFELVGRGHYTQISESTRFIDLAQIVTYRRKGVYDFVDPDSSLEDIRKAFYEAVNERRKLEVLFLTTTGTKEGDLLGMITIWDLATI